MEIITLKFNKNKNIIINIDFNYEFIINDLNNYIEILCYFQRNSVDSNWMFSEEKDIIFIIRE